MNSSAPASDTRDKTIERLHQALTGEEARAERSANVARTLTVAIVSRVVLYSPEPILTKDSAPFVGCVHHGRNGNP